MTANEIHVIVSQVCIRLALCKNGIYASETTVIADVPKLIHIDWWVAKTITDYHSWWLIIIKQAQYGYFHLSDGYWA